MCKKWYNKVNCYIRWKFGVDFVNIKVVSFNIRNCNDPDGNSVSERYPRLEKLLSECDADVIGLQEYKPIWKKYIKKFCNKKYKMYKKYRDLKSREATPILWNNEKFACIEKGKFWLSDTPRKKSKGWDELYDCYRICVYVVLKNRETGEKFTFMNTHFGFGDDGQTKSANLIRDYSKKISDYPTVLVGDFNMEVGSAGYNAATKYFTDANVATINDRRPTFNGYGKGDEHIDYCFVNDKVKVNEFKIVDARVDGKYASDHNGIYINLSL